MKTRWTEGLETEDDISAMKYEYEKSFKARQRLKYLLEKEINSIVVNMTSDEHFDKDWALLQANRIAHIKAYQKVIGLLE